MVAFSFFFVLTTAVSCGYQVDYNYSICTESVGQGKLPSCDRPTWLYSINDAFKAPSPASCVYTFISDIVDGHAEAHRTLEQTLHYSQNGDRNLMLHAENFVCSLSMSVSIDFGAIRSWNVSCSPIAKKSIKSLFWRSRSSKVINFGANREPVYDFLLVHNSNLGPNSHRYWDTATYWLKTANFSYPLSFSALVRGDLLRIYGKALRFLKLESFQAADGENSVILACTVFDWSTRVTDGQTELRWLRRAKAIAAFARKKWQGKNWD